MNWTELLLGQIPEALYFALFVIYTKKLDSKRTLFLILTIIDYILLFNFIPVSVWSHILYFGITYIVLKLLYKEKSQITDVFTLGVASIVLIAISAISYIICMPFTSDIIIANFLQKIGLFVFLHITRNKLSNIQRMYKWLWNRNDKVAKPIKSTTFRCINAVLLNLMFFAIHVYIVFYIIRRC